MFLTYNHWKRRFRLIHSAFIGVICLLCLAGCDTPPEVATDYSRIFFVPHFTIKNERSRAQDIELTSVVIDENGIPLSQEGAQSYRLDPGQETELETSIARSAHEKNSMSFLIAIDGTHYAGWAADAVPSNITIIAYGLGYVCTDPEGNFPPLLRSTLEPRVIEAGERENSAFYTVTLTDEGIVFVLDKQIDGLYPSF